MKIMLEFYGCGYDCYTISLEKQATTTHAVFALVDLFYAKYTVIELWN